MYKVIPSVIVLDPMTTNFVTVFICFYLRRCDLYRLIDFTCQRYPDFWFILRYMSVGILFTINGIRKYEKPRVVIVDYHTSFF